MGKKRFYITTGDNADEFIAPNVETAFKKFLEKYDGPYGIITEFYSNTDLEPKIILTEHLFNKLGIKIYKHENMN